MQFFKTVFSTFFFFFFFVVSSGAIDFRVGIEALPNQAPTVDPVGKVDWLEVGAPANQITVSGISDGNPLLEQELQIELINNNTDASTVSVVSFDTLNGIAVLEYVPGSERGISTVTMIVRDDGGMQYSDEVDSTYTTFLIEVRDPSVNNPPSFGIPANTIINPVTGQNAIIIPNISDGDGNKEQQLSFSAVSSDETILVVDSIVYHDPDHVALLYVTEFGNQGIANIEITLTDDGGSDGSGADSFTASFPVKTEIQIDQPGVLYEAFDYDFWRPMPYRQNPVVEFDSILPSTNAKNVYDDDFFWMRMSGYIIPKMTGEYVFSTEDHEGSFLFLSSDYDPDNLPPEEEPTAYKKKVDGVLQDIQSDPITLEAGKIYYFEAYDAEVVITYNFAVEWTGPGINSMQPIT